MKWPPAVNNRHFESTCVQTSSEVAHYRLSSVTPLAALCKPPFQPPLCASSRPSTCLRVPVRPANRAVKPGLSPPGVTSRVVFPWRGVSAEERLWHGVGTERTLFRLLSVVRRRKHKPATDAVCEAFYATATPPKKRSFSTGGKGTGERFSAGTESPVWDAGTAQQGRVSAAHGSNKRCTQQKIRRAA